MMNTVTLYRCGLAWLFVALFLYDGGKFVRGQENKADVEGNEITHAGNDPASDAAGFALPEWFESESEFSDATRMLFVRTRGEHISKSEARQALEEESVEAIYSVVRNSQRISDPRTIGLQPAYVLQNFVYDDRLEFQEVTCTTQAEKPGNSSSKSYIGYVQLDLGDKFQAYLQIRLRELKTKERLVTGGLVGGLILGLLAVVFGYLKLETATRGFYSRRLQTGAIAVAFILLWLVYWFGQQWV